MKLGFPYCIMDLVYDCVYSGVMKHISIIVDRDHTMNLEQGNYVIVQVIVLFTQSLIAIH